MKKLFSNIYLSMVLGVCAFTQGQALENLNIDYVAVDAGYRWDKISNRATLGGSTISVKGATQIMREVNSFQLGGRGQASFCGNAFMRLQGHYGWVLDGEYSEGGFDGRTRGHTDDVSGSIGYYYEMTPSVWFAPIVGWGYDELNLKGTGIKTAIDGTVFSLDGIKAHQEFNGPFAGFDFLFQANNCYAFTFGYEFHYVTWHGKREIQGPDYGNPPYGAVTGYSNKRHIDNVYGNVFKLDGTWAFCGCWYVGIGLKYQCYNGDSGKYKRTSTPLISQYDYAKVDGLWWRSFASTVYVGTAF